MLTGCLRVFVLVLLFMLEGRDAWVGQEQDKEKLFRIGRDLVYDLMRKADTVWRLKEDYGKYSSFSVGEIVFIIRTKFSEMVRLYLRGITKEDWTVTNLIRNITNMQRMIQQLYVLQDELLKFEQDGDANNNISSSNSKFYPGLNCQAAGTMYIPNSIVNPYRREQDTRRQNIIKTYMQNESVKPPIDVGKDLTQSLKLKVERNRNEDVEFMDLAPDFL